MYDWIRDAYSSGKGVIRLAADRIVATGLWSALPTAAVDFRGGLARKEGGAGVSDSLHFCRKDAADAYVWTQLSPISPTVTTRTDTAVVAGGAGGAKVVTCAAGETVIAGGFHSSVNSANISIMYSRPDGSNGWEARMQNATGGNATLTTYALCLTSPI